MPSEPVDGDVFGRLLTFLPPTRVSQFAEETAVDDKPNPMPSPLKLPSLHLWKWPYPYYIRSSSDLPKLSTPPLRLTRRPTFINVIFEYFKFKFKVLYFLKICPIFVSSVDNFVGPWHDIMKRCLFPLDACYMHSSHKLVWTVSNVHIVLANWLLMISPFFSLNKSWV